MRFDATGRFVGLATLAGLLAHSCAVPSPAERVADFRKVVMAHVDALDDGWDDWQILLGATHVALGFVVIQEDIEATPEEHLHGELKEPTFLLGASAPSANEFLVYNTTIRRAYAPVYSGQLVRANGSQCLLFLQEGHVMSTWKGKVPQLCPVEEFEWWAQLDDFLQLARTDPVQIAALVAREDADVESILERLATVADSRSGIQLCCDEIRALGDRSLPGVLHSMLRALEDPGYNTNLCGSEVVKMDPEGIPISARCCEDAFDLLALVALDKVSWNWERDLRARLRLVRMLALELLRHGRA